MYPKNFQKLINNFSSLPSIGPKMAERLVLFLFKQDAEKLENFSHNISNLTHLRFCKKCFNISENELCHFCANSKRQQTIICIVEDPLDILSIERTRTYNGLYHVIGGTIENKKQDDKLKIPDLLKRVHNEQIEEIIIATNPTTEGDLTALYLKRKLKEFNIKITRLARGLSTGGDIEYADEITLSSALANRSELK